VAAFSGFASKLVATVAAFSGLALKLVATVSPGLTSKPIPYFLLSYFCAKSEFFSL
jgi:hypothetical protein